MATFQLTEKNITFSCYVWIKMLHC